MTAWGYVLTPPAARAIRQLDQRSRGRVFAALDRMVERQTGLGGDVAKLRGHEEEWRLRVGDWRVRFRRDAETRTIIVVAIAPRGRAYRR